MLDSTQPDQSTALNLHSKNSDIFLLLEFLALAFCIFIGSYFHPDGFLSSDSTSYLALAKNLVEGNGFYISGFGYSGNEKDFFAIWPAGYPVLIALIAKLTGVSVFWSSKILNALLAGMSFLMFRKVFSENAYVYGMLFLFGASIVIYLYTWSESLFIFSLIGYAIATANTLCNTQDWIKQIGLMSLFSLLLFMARYIGAFSIISTILLSCYYYFKERDRKKSFVLLLAATINSLIVAIYLLNNLTLTDYLTGMPRIPSTESNIELLQQLSIAVISEMIITIPYVFPRPEFLIIIIIQILCFIFFLQQKPKINIKQPNRYCIFSLTFIFIGIFYLISLVSLRWITHFDDFFFRLLFPGSILIFTGILRHIEINFQQRFKQISKIFMTLTSFTVVVILIEILSSPHSLTYKEKIAKIEQEYSGVKSGSVVAFGSMHLKYLRNDILLWSPWSLPYDKKKESWNDFIARVGTNRSIYLAYPENELIEKNYDESVKAIVEKQSVNNITQIK